MIAVPSTGGLSLLLMQREALTKEQLSERILDIDINVKICYISSGEINRDALREIHPTISLGCFIKKPVTIDYLVGKIMNELE